MGQPGYAQYGWHFEQDSTLAYLTDKGAKYLLFAEEGWLDSARVRPYLRRPMGRHGRVQLFDLQGLDELTSDTMRMHDHEVYGRASVVDTTTSRNGVVRFHGSARPLELDQLLKKDLPAVSAELSVKGLVHTAKGCRPGLHLVVVQRNEDQVVTYRAVPLTDGPFSMDVLLTTRGGSCQDVLFVENSSGLPFELQDVQVEVRYHRDDP